MTDYYFPHHHYPPPPPFTVPVVFHPIGVGQPPPEGFGSGNDERENNDENNNGEEYGPVIDPQLQEEGSTAPAAAAAGGTGAGTGVATTSTTATAAAAGQEQQAAGSTAPRVCSLKNCGTALPPKDVYNYKMCPTCRTKHQGYSRVKRSKRRQEKLEAGLPLRARLQSKPKPQLYRVNGQLAVDPAWVHLDRRLFGPPPPPPPPPEPVEVKERPLPKDGYRRKPLPPKDFGAITFNFVPVKICSIKGCYQPIPVEYERKTCLDCQSRCRVYSGRKRERYKDRMNTSGDKKEDGKEGKENDGDERNEEGDHDDDDEGDHVGMEEDAEAELDVEGDADHDAEMSAMQIDPSLLDATPLNRDVGEGGSGGVMSIDPALRGDHAQQNGMGDATSTPHRGPEEVGTTVPASLNRSDEDPSSRPNVGESGEGAKPGDQPIQGANAPTTANPSDLQYH